MKIDWFSSGYVKIIAVDTRELIPVCLPPMLALYIFGSSDEIEIKKHLIELIKSAEFKQFKKDILNNDKGDNP